VFLNCQ